MVGQPTTALAQMRLAKLLLPVCASTVCLAAKWWECTDNVHELVPWLVSNMVDQEVLGVLGAPQQHNAPYQIELYSLRCGGAFCLLRATHTHAC